MIISQVIGGLGNQMFQYAAGRALALERRTALSLDLAAFERYRLHQGYELERAFGLKVGAATGAALREVLGWQASLPLRAVLARRQLAPLRKREFVVEPHFQYWSGIRAIGGDAYLSGYWQSEKYFSKVAKQIREDFAFRQALNDANAAVAAAMAGVQAVSLHVRRGDYVSNSATTSTHGLCSSAYYGAAIAHVAAHVAKPMFYVFSDDIEWVRAHIPIGFAHHFVAHNQGVESYNDMRLMSLCKHHIIANSSFSWWGAWLNPASEKIVVAPQKWFAIAKDVGDLYPAGWTRL